MQISYAREKLHSAVTGMAVSANSIERRVCDAYIYDLIHIRPAGLPPEMSAELTEIAAVMSTRQAFGDKGGAWASCSKLSDDDDCDVARKIVDLWERVDSSDPMRTWN
ncbi:hypothetical protein J2Y55_002153 [Bosea sp. BE125]|uniref:hypothetical protein n=1 Tax=Bosea sp. BE125 TaxID=2817909 RepID=UPI002857493F|nr:hypothetical protein [Bosea sp. BE125]MDR6871145.1 hypothetical protein [Bosea sp. BE125]